MKNALEWIKSNPISALAAVVIVLGFAAYIYYPFVGASSFTSRVADENASMQSDLNQYLRATVPWPNPDPNGMPIEVGPLVINDDVIERVREVYQGQAQAATLIKGEAQEHNKTAHGGVMLGGGRLFPEAQSVTILTDAKEQYLASFDANFEANSNPRLGMKAMRVGMPPVEQAQLLVDQLVADYLESVGAEKASDLSQVQGEELFHLQQKELIDLLRRTADSINLYTDNSVTEVDPARAVAQAQTNKSPDYPFEIAPWAYEDDNPTMDELWEAQVQLWIIRDTMGTIYQVNDVASAESNVIASPVKRLYRLNIIPGYVGLHTTGGLNSDIASRGGGGSSGSPSGGGGGGGGGFNEFGEFGGFDEFSSGGFDTSGMNNDTEAEDGESTVYGSPEATLPADPATPIAR